MSKSLCYYLLHTQRKKLSILILILPSRSTNVCLLSFRCSKGELGRPLQRPRCGQPFDKMEVHLQAKMPWKMETCQGNEEMPMPTRTRLRFCLKMPILVQKQKYAIFQTTLTTIINYIYSNWIDHSKIYWQLSIARIFSHLSNLSPRLLLLLLTNWRLATLSKKLSKGSYPRQKRVVIW